MGPKNGHDTHSIRLDLCLSGGGFRATFFHLGVLRLLRDLDLLRQVRSMCSVSGGSIVAAHVCLNWDRYATTAHDDGPFFSASAELALMGLRDIRGRCIRRAAVLGIAPRFRVTRQLERYYSQLLNDARLEDISGSAPDLHLLSTSVTTGALVDFSAKGVGFSGGTWKSPTVFPASSLPLARGVTASSAFPPLVAPIRIDRRDLHAKESEFPHVEYLTDGGVFDNLGIHRMMELHGAREQGALLVVSDASAGFDSRIDRHSWGLVSRNVRASDILMSRVSELESHALASSRRVIKLVAIGDIVTPDDISIASEFEPQQVDLQRACRFVRTDLDAFSLEEIQVLARHGYETALSALAVYASPTIEKELITDPAPAGWPFYLDLIQPTRLLGRVIDGLVSVEENFGEIDKASREIFGSPYTDVEREASAKQLEERRKEALDRAAAVRRMEGAAVRRARLWSRDDPFSWGTLVIILLILATVLFLVL